MAFTQKDEERIARAVRDIETMRMGGPVMRGAGTPGWSPHNDIVYVTSVITVNGRYPGKWVSYAAATNTITLEDDIWVISIAGVQLAVGYYHAVRKAEAGPAGDDRPVWVTLDAGDVTYRTDCVGGINYRYRKTPSTPWVFDSLQGCCDCPATPSGSTGNIAVDCCPVPLPSILCATIESVIGAAALDGLVVPIIWNGTSWIGFIDPALCGGKSPGIAITCPVGGTSCSSFYFGAPFPDLITPASCSCDPFGLFFENLVVVGACAGTINITIAEGDCGTAPSGISRASLDRVSGTHYPLTIPGKTVSSGALLVVGTAHVGTGTVTGVTFAGISLAASAFGNSATVQTWHLGMLADTTGDIVISGTGDIIFGIAIEVIGLALNVPDTGADDTGAASSPDTGATSATGVADEYAQAFFLLHVPGGTWTWENDFTDGAQDETHGAYVFTEGFDILSATGAVEAILSGITPTDWKGMVATYK